VTKGVGDGDYRSPNSLHAAHAQAMANAESMTTSLGADPYSRRIAGSVIAQQLGLGFVTAVDPTQGEQGMIVGNFLTLLGITLLFATDMHRCRSCSG
jgi:hypothetical protein